MRPRNAKLFPASYSKLSTYETCALKAKFRYIDKVPSKKGKAAARGTGIHDGIEQHLLKGRIPIPEEAEGIAKVIKQVARQPGKLIEYQMALDDTLENTVPWKSPKARFRLVMDAAYLVNRLFVIKEWKSGKVWPDHPDQRRIYAMASFAFSPLVDKTEVTTHYLDLGKKATFKTDAKKRKLLIWGLQQRLEVMETDRHFAPRPGRYCFWCDYSKRKGGPCPVG